MVKHFFPPLFILSLFLTFGTSTASSATPDSAAKESKSEDPLDALKQGDPAGKVKTLLGDPVEIKPMKAPTGKAEVWVYVREIARRMDRVDRSTQAVVVSVTEPDGTVRQRITPGQVRFEDVQYVMEDVIEVLVFNSHYVTRKVSRLERKL